jgi:asparagine synthase (glutamine-hydrolysing)
VSGFVGILHSQRAPVDPSLLRRMTDAMSYCGPDRRDVWLEGHVGLGHALLAPTPDSTGDDRQPLSLDGRVWIAADARIDGRRPGAPDAELILKAYLDWGEHCVDHLIGDFAFAIWDGREQRLFSARDHFGVVPLYYARVGNGIVVGNVLRALRLHPAVSDELDKRAVGDFLLFSGNMDLATTTFADVRAVPPGHVLTWHDGTVRVRRYWQPPEPQPELRLERPEEYVERFTVLFDQAVGDRLRSPRAGAHLSGGMDSTSVAATAHHALRSRSPDFDLRAYTVVFDRLVAEEEGRYADQVAAHIGLPVEHFVGDDYMARPPEADPFWVLPEPGEILGQSALHEVGRRVASFSRALLSGVGGDPLFSVPFRRPPVWRTLRDGHLPRFGLRTGLRRRLRGGRPDPPPLPDWIDAGFSRDVDLQTRWREVFAEWDGVRGRRAMLQPVWPAIFARSHPGASGLLARALFPFFDLRLVQYVWELPTHPLRADKRLLREAMRGRLPEAVLQRPKTPLYAARGRVHRDDPSYLLALLPETRRWRLELISDPAIGEYVDVERAKSLIDSPVPRRTVPSFENCFALAHWLQSGPAARGRPHPRKETRHAGDPTAA